MANDRVQIDIQADAAQAEQALESVRQKLDALKNNGAAGGFGLAAQNAANSAKNILTPFNNIAKVLQGPLQTLGRFHFVLGVITSAAALAAAGIAAIANQITKAARESEALENRIRATASAIKNLGVKDPLLGIDPRIKDILTDIRKKRDELAEQRSKGEISAQDEAFFNTRLDQREKKEIEAARKIATAERDAKRSAARADEQQARDDARKRYEAEINELEDRVLPENERIRRKMARDIEEAFASVRDVPGGFDSALIDRRIEAIKAAAEFDIKKNEEVERKREDDALKTNERIAEDMAEQMTKAFQDALRTADTELERSINQTNAKLTLSVDSLLRYVQLIYGNQPSGGR